MSVVTVALPVLDGGDRLAAVLDAVAAQEVDHELELLVCDSGSIDGSVAIAREHGARLLQIPRADFSHGATRNLLMREATGDHVAFLTQDSRPLARTWLATLLAGFAQAPDVALTYGPYRACPGASATTARDIARCFAGLSPDGRPRIDRLGAGERDVPASALLGAPAFFSDANGAVAKPAWREVPFRDIPYAEDQQLAIDMLRAGYAKVYLPAAAAEHSHEYSPRRRVQRSFDEARALREVFGWAEALNARLLRDRVLAPARADVRWARTRGAQPAALAPIAAHALAQHAARTIGAVLGGRHERLPAGLRRRLSLESRPTFEPIDGADRS